MYFKESTNNSRILTSESGDKFYIREQRVKLPKKRELLTNESHISSQSSIYGNNVTLEDSIEKSLERIKPSKQEGREKGYPPEHVHIQAEGKLKCACTICTAQNLLKTEPDDAFTDPFFVEHQGELTGNVINNKKGFIFVLKRLMPRKHFLQSLSIKIPETLVYLDGEARFFVMTGKDKTLKFVSQREKLAQHEIKKFFKDRFAQKDEEQRTSETRNTLESRNLILTSNDVATEERTQGIELRKGTPTVGLITGRNTRHKASRSLKSKSTSSNREVALLKYNDDSTTILYDTEFECLMTKKKFDPYWKNIAFIQNYRGFSKFIHTLQRVYFLYDREKENPMFARAAAEIHQINQEVSPSSETYIPAYEEDEFQKSLRNHNESEYCLYLMMKVYHFIEIVHGIRIVKMCGEFVKDTLDSLWLTNVSHLQYIKAIDENHTKGASVFRMETEEKFSLDDSTAPRDAHRKDDVGVLTELMQKQYENIKRGVALKEPTIGYEEDISDNIFAQLYPNAPYKLSLLLRNPKTNNPKNIASDTSFRAGTVRRVTEDESKSGPIKGVYLGMTKNTPQAVNALSHNISGNQSNRSLVRSRVMRPRADSTVNTSRTGTGRTLPSLGNIDSSTNVTAAPEAKKQVQKKENTRSNSQPNLKKVFKFYGISPSMNQYPKVPNDTFKEAHPRILKRTPSEIFAQIQKAPKLTPGEDFCTERCTPIADGPRNSNPNTPYVKGLRGLSRGLQEKLVGHLDHGTSTRRSQSVHKKSLGYILNN